MHLLFISPDSFYIRIHRIAQLVMGLRMRFPAWAVGSLQQMPPSLASSKEIGQLFGNNGLVLFMMPRDTVMLPGRSLIAETLLKGHYTQQRQK